MNQQQPWGPHPGPHHYQQPPQPYPYSPYPPPGYPAQKPTPWHHIVTWPAFALATVAQIVATTMPADTYPLMLILGYLAAIAGVGALIVASQARHGWCIAFATFTILTGIMAIIIGHGAMGEHQQALDALRSYRH